jgi:hypothetical protein
MLSDIHSIPLEKATSGLSWMKICDSPCLWSPSICNRSKNYLFQDTRGCGQLASFSALHFNGPKLDPQRRSLFSRGINKSKNEKLKEPPGNQIWPGLLCTPSVGPEEADLAEHRPLSHLSISKFTVWIGTKKQVFFCSFYL